MIDLKLQSGERVVWHHIAHVGFFHRRLLSYMAITNTEVLLINHPNADSPPLYYRLALSDATDVVVMNKHNVGSGYYSGVSTGRYWSRSYGGYTVHNSESVGDLAFMVHGQPKITFKNISDPNGVRQLVLSVKKR